MPVIGFLSSSALADRARYLTAFRQGIRETGYVEGQKIELRSADEHLVTDFIRRPVAVIVGNTPSVRADLIARYNKDLAWDGRVLRACVRPHRGRIGARAGAAVIALRG
jgi:hypothetical protein